MTKKLNLEESAIGDLLISPGLIDRCKGLLEVADFTATENQIIYKAMLSLHSKGTPIDVLTLTKELRKTGEYVSVGGANYLAKIIQNIDPIGALNPAEAQLTILKLKELSDQ